MACSDPDPHREGTMRKDQVSPGHGNLGGGGSANGTAGFVGGMAGEAWKPVSTES